MIDQKSIKQVFGEYLDSKLKSISFLLQSNTTNSLDAMKGQFRDLVNVLYDTFFHIKVMFYSGHSNDPSLLFSLLTPIVQKFSSRYSNNFLQTPPLDWIQSACNSWLHQAIQTIELLGKNTLHVATKAQHLKEIEKIILESINLLENPKPDGEKWSQVFLNFF